LTDKENVLGVDVVRVKEQAPAQDPRLVHQTTHPDTGHSPIVVIEVRALRAVTVVRLILVRRDEQPGFGIRAPDRAEGARGLVDLPHVLEDVEAQHDLGAHPGAQVNHLISVEETRLLVDADAGIPIYSDVRGTHRKYAPQIQVFLNRFDIGPNIEDRAADGCLLHDGAEESDHVRCHGVTSTGTTH
jgi:hypothetical protein